SRATRPPASTRCPYTTLFRSVLEAFQGADVALGRGRLADAEYPGGLGVGQFLEVSQRQDLPVERVEGVERRLEPQQPLGPDRGRSEEHTSELQSHLNLVCRRL